MRLITGVILGFLLTVAVAYWHDSGAAPGEAGMTSGRIVNWDVADRTFRDARDTVVRGFHRMTGGADDRGDDERRRL